MEDARVRSVSLRKPVSNNVSCRDNIQKSIVLGSMLIIRSMKMLLLRAELRVRKLQKRGLKEPIRVLALDSLTFEATSGSLSLSDA